MKNHRAASSVFNLLLPACAACLLTACAGCATFNNDPIPEQVVRIIDPVHFDVNGEIFAPDDLPKALKRAGAGEDTKISLQLPPGTAPNAYVMVYANVREAGFRQVIFTHPREATATVKPAAAPTPKPARKASPVRTLRRK
ncbi:MAG: hypothetical protein R6X19_03165 [Kiritimatiellia bacterium]